LFQFSFHPIMRISTIFFVLMLFGLASCIQVENQYSKLPPGQWRGVLLLDYNPVNPNPKAKPRDDKVDFTYEEVAAGELPFNFEIKYSNDTSFFIELRNGEEIITLDDISFGRDIRTANDTVVIRFPPYDSYIRAIYKENVMEGHWIDKTKDNYSIPFVAQYGRSHRFTVLKNKPEVEVDGRWDVNFGIETKAPYPAIGEFYQEGNLLTGTFLTETGDYRYLEGTVQKDKFYLSCFDGAHAFLFEAKKFGEDTLTGSFRSGKHYQTLWEAFKNPDATLSDPHKLTYLKEGFDRISFEFKNLEGRMVSSEDEKFKGKVHLIQIFGSWCPNCIDETAFLNEYLKKNPNPDLVVTGLAFEPYSNKKRAFSQLKRFQEKMGAEFELLWTGPRTPKPEEKLPMLNAILSYPTLIFIDKQGEIRRIHTGFSGPATSEYQAFSADFESFMNLLLNE